MKYFLFSVLALSSFGLILSKSEFGDDRNLGFWNHWLNQWTGHVICRVEGFFPDPQICNQFYECVKIDKFQFMKYEFTCAPGTVFDIRLQMCVYPLNANTASGCSSGHDEENGKPPPIDAGHDDDQQIKPPPPDCFLGNCQVDPPIGIGDDEENDDPCSKRQRCDIPDFDDFPKACGCENGTHCIYDIRMQYVTGSPDGVLKRMFGFNGRFPGPTLYCTRGKILVVRVTNSVDDDDETTSIHWHGIEQNLSPFYDGPESVTQCPIIRNETMTYEFRLYQSGTYWYHSHHSYQYTDGAWGFLIVRNKPVEVWANTYDAETLISINDWQHDSARIVSERYLINGSFPFTESTLINGRGTFPCNQTTPNQTCDTTLQQPAIIKVKCGKTYRIRILNSSGVRSYNISIDNHKMRIIETDGVDTVMGPLGDILPTLPAQRYSILVSMNQPNQNYWIRVWGNDPPFVGSRGTAVAILQYECDNIVDINQATTDAQSNVNVEGIMNIGPHADAEQGRPDFQHIPWTDIIKQGGITPSSPSKLRKYFPFGLPSITDEQSNYDRIHAARAEIVIIPITTPTDNSVILDPMDCPPFSYMGNGDAPEGPDQLVTIDQDDCGLPGNPGARLCMNGSPYEPLGKTAIPILFQMIKNITIPDTARPIYTPELQKVIRIILNNRHQFDHPWHLHGHTFWVCGFGPAGAGDFNATRDEPSLTRKGVRRDTTFSHGNSWMCIEYISNNPGTWFFHCHINPHLEAGLGMTFVEGQTIAQQVYNVTPIESILVCDKVGVQLY